MLRQAEPECQEEARVPRGAKELQQGAGEFRQEGPECQEECQEARVPRVVGELCQEEPECQEEARVPRGARELQQGDGELRQEEPECREEARVPRGARELRQGARELANYNYNIVTIKTRLHQQAKTEASYQPRLRPSPRGEVHYSNTLTQHSSYISTKFASPSRQTSSRRRLHLREGSSSKNHLSFFSLSL